MTGVGTIPESAPHGLDELEAGETACRVLMLVTARADGALRAAVEAGTRPRPEFLVLESRYAVELLDLSRIAGRSGPRTLGRTARHLVAGWRRLDGVDVLVSDSEHLGIPLGLALRARPRPIAHVVIAHHLMTRAKAVAFRRLHAHAGMTRLLVHSEGHRRAACEKYGIPTELVGVLQFGVDLEFWRPAGLEEEGFVLAPGRDHRDFETLALALANRSYGAVVTGFSEHAKARHTSVAWPSNVRTGGVSLLELRDLYARAAVVAVPVVATTSSAGITSVLEAMAMGRAVVVSASPGLEGLIVDGVTGIVVPPGDPAALRAALDALIADPALRAALGANARAEAERRFGVDAHAAAIHRELLGAARRARA